MNILKIITVTATISALGMVPQLSFAGESNHQHSAHQKSAERMGGQHEGMHEDMSDHHGEMNGSMQKAPKMFLVKKKVADYTVSFHVMPVKDGMQHGGSHNLMVKVEANGTALTNVSINSKVFYADKSTASKMLMKMGDWYMAGYDLGQDGQHGIMVLFKTVDGQKHKASVYYPEGK